MLSGLFEATTIPVLEQVVNFAQARHNILAGNVANIDTPGYHMRDLSAEMFQDRLKSAIRHRDEMHTAMPIQSPGRAEENPISTVGTSIADMLHHDDIERQPGRSGDRDRQKRAAAQHGAGDHDQPVPIAARGNQRAGITTA